MQRNVLAPVHSNATNATESPPHPVDTFAGYTLSTIGSDQPGAGGSKLMDDTDDGLEADLDCDDKDEDDDEDDDEEMADNHI